MVRTRRTSTHRQDISRRLIETYDATRTSQTSTTRNRTAKGASEAGDGTHDN